MCHIILLSAACPTYIIFFHIISQTSRFSEHIIEHKMCGLIFYTTFLSETFLIPKRIQPDTVINGRRRWRSWWRHCATSQKAAGSITDYVIGIFHYLILPAFDSASNRNEHQEYFLEGKGGRSVRLTTLPPLCADWKSGSLNLLEPSGPAQAYAGIALPFTVLLGL